MARLLQWTQGMHCTTSNDSRVNRTRRALRTTLVAAPAPAPPLAAFAPAGGASGQILLSDVLAGHLEIAINRIDVLTDCVDLLARHLAGAIDRIELLEGRLQRSAGAEAVIPTRPRISEPDAEHPATSPAVPGAVDATVRPTLTILRDVALLRNSAGNPQPTSVASTAATPPRQRSDQFSDMTTFLHAVVSSQRQTAAR